MTRNHTCARCGRALGEGEYVFSNWTRSRYCYRDLKACEKRAARRASQVARVPA